MKKIIDGIKKDAGQLQETEKKLEAARFAEAACTERGKLSEIRTDVAFFEKQVEKLKSEVSGGIEKFLTKGAENYDATALKDLERFVIAEGGRSLSILLAVLSEIRRGDSVRELLNINLPSEIRDQAATYRDEALAVVSGFVTERQRNERFAAIKNNRDLFENKRGRIFGMVMRGDFSLLELEV